MDYRGANESGLTLNREDREVSVIDIEPFCDKLEKFIKYIENVKDLNFFTYEYQNILKNRLETSVQDLETILTEVREALINSERLKNQRKSIKTEKITVKKILKRMRDDEIKEMESVVSQYDKPMHTRWESVKTTQKPEVLEIMLTDIKGKKLALDHLTILATRKLGQIRIFQPSNNSRANNEKNSKEKTIIPLPFTSFCNPIIPPPPPLPPISLIAPVSHLPKRSHTQRSTIQRRKRLERRDENLERRCVVSGSPRNDNIPLVSLPALNNLSTNLLLANNLYPAIFNPINNSENAVRNLSNTVTLLDMNDDDNDNRAGTTDLGREFQNEMQTVLQALFGELRSAPTILISESNSENAAEIENESNTDKEIELYTLKKIE